MDLTNWIISRKLSIREKQLLIILCRASGMKVYNESDWDITSKPYTCHTPIIGLSGSQYISPSWMTQEKVPVVQYEEIVKELKNRINET